MSQVKAKRIESLMGFAKALRGATARAMPAGYVGATDDRNRYVSPVEQVIWDLEQEALNLAKE